MPKMRGRLLWRLASSPRVFLSTAPVSLRRFWRGGSLFDLVEGSNEAPLKPVPARRIMKAILQALEAAHAVRLGHGDINPLNILLNEDATEICLVDFDCSSTARVRWFVPGGTVAYTAPEILKPIRRGGFLHIVREADVFAAGLVFLDMLGGTPPAGHQAVLTHAGILEDIAMYNDIEIMEDFIACAANHVDGDGRPLLRRLLIPRSRSAMHRSVSPEGPFLHRARAAG